MSISQKLQRRAITPGTVRTDASAVGNPSDANDSAANIAGDVVPWYIPERAAVGGGVDDPLTPKPSPLLGPNASR